MCKKKKHQQNKICNRAKNSPHPNRREKVVGTNTMALVVIVVGNDDVVNSHFLMCVTMAHIDMVNVQHFHIETSHAACCHLHTHWNIGIFLYVTKLTAKRKKYDKREIKSLCKVHKTNGWIFSNQESGTRIFYTYGIPNNSFSNAI